eukprot:TRINITY_DN12642_c0_g1_i1.p1 TRINITY_DN12642_c0_g1~~TRINITY_DN12642_c0_g1_i1.p1  ORF type:complete len:133 (-),score=40.18 TRINITY_DN12642_c0_g1_i1:178-528(-)
MSSNPIEQIEELLNQIESNGVQFFEKLSHTLVTGYPNNERTHDYNTLLNLITTLENALQQSLISYTSEQTASDPLSKLISNVKDQTNTKDKEHKRVLKNIERARNSLLKQQAQQMR